mmetsp:Transcript_4704/g.7270  ORF Transcript_4704/g.7270 Transcript_4704/m.7270 type:complete len:83 (-) Transcript_4704:16-264(-)
MCIIICLLVGLSFTSFRQSSSSLFTRGVDDGLSSQSVTTVALPSSGPIEDMSMSANTAAAAAASVADGLDAATIVLMFIIIY